VKIAAKDAVRLGVLEARPARTGLFAPIAMGEPAAFAPTGDPMGALREATTFVVSVAGD
jgi:hypothetical protein